MFKVREKLCSFNKTVFEEERDSFNCRSSINVYHCIQNEKNRSGEICIQPVWVQPNYCPEYNTGANTLDTVPCNVSTGSCPDVLFLSNEVYKYPVCLNKTFTDSENISKENVSTTPVIDILVAVAVPLFVLLLVCVIVCCLRRRGQHKRGDEEMPLIDDFNLEKPFYKTSAFHEGVKFLNNGGKILCLVGRWGSGRTSTAKQVYVAVTKSSPLIISDPLSFDVSEHNEPIIVDQVPFKGLTNAEKKHIRDKINILFENMSSSTKAFIILIFNDDQNTVSEFVRSLVTQEKETKFIDLSNSLTKGDRTQILSSQFETFCSNKDFSKFENLALKGKDHSLGYPEICALFCRCSVFQNNLGPIIFCNLPFKYLKLYLENMHFSKDSRKFLSLVYMSLNEMEINVHNQNDIFIEIQESCNCDSTSNETKCETEQTELTETEVIGDTSNTTQEEFPGKKAKKHYRSREYISSLIPMDFVNKVPGASVYRLQHDVIKRMTLIVFGTYHFDKLLELSKPEELKEWVKEKSKTTIVAQGDIKPVLEIGGEQWSQYQEKLK